MKHGRLMIEPEQCVLPDVKKTTHFLERLCGLLLRKKLQANEALYITPCSSVHTLGMRYSIDLIYVDKECRIVKMVKTLRPCCFSICHSAQGVIELNANKLQTLNLEIGQRLIWKDI